MGRLIDADELSKWISGQSKSPSCPKNESAFGLRIMKHIDRMSSARPDIITCKDCKHRYEDECPMYHVEWVEYEDDGYIDMDDVIYDYTEDDGYCFKAER